MNEERYYSPWRVRRLWRALRWGLELSRGRSGEERPPRRWSFDGGHEFPACIRADLERARKTCWNRWSKAERRCWLWWVGVITSLGIPFGDKLRLSQTISEDVARELGWPDGRTADERDDEAAGYWRSGRVAGFLGVSERTVQRWADEGKLPCDLTTGGHRRFVVRVVVAWRAKRLVGRKRAA